MLDRHLLASTTRLRKAGTHSLVALSNMSALPANNVFSHTKIFSRLARQELMILTTTSLANLAPKEKFAQFGSTNT